MNTETTMTVSAARVAANRRNAQRSTGPISPHGKAVSRLNARKHRSLAGAVLVRGRQLRESAPEFRALCQEYYASLVPVGPLEEMLVDEIVQAAWRLRRVRSAESGEIALKVDKGWERRQDENPVARILAEARSPFSGLLRPKLERSVAGCSYLGHCLRKLRLAVEAVGELTEAAMNDFEKSLADEPDTFVSWLAKLREELAVNPEKLEPDALRAQHKKEVLRLIEDEMMRLLDQEEDCERQERVEERARQSASVLPGVESLDRILRYEKGLERQLYGAMKQLQVFQGKRQRLKGKRWQIVVPVNPVFGGTLKSARRTALPARTRVLPQNTLTKALNFGENEPNNLL